MKRPARKASLLLFACLFLLAACEPTLGGRTWYDHDGDGNPGSLEGGLAGEEVWLLGVNPSGTVDRAVLSGPDGSYTFGSIQAGTYLIDAVDPAGHRLTSPKTYGQDLDRFPVGLHRFSNTRYLADRLREASPSDPVEHVALGDSIVVLGDYVETVTGRLAAINPNVVLDKQAIGGWRTTDLLIRPHPTNTVWSAADAGADLVTLSIIGNDLTGVTSLDDFVEVLVEARQNLQEILSSLVSALPEADIVLNTQYDPAQGGDPLYDVGVAMLNDMMRRVAFGQRRRVAIAEVWAEFRHFDVERLSFFGFPDLIHSDRIHPNDQGYEVITEKLWEAVGGVGFGTESVMDCNFGYMEHMETLFPSSFADITSGASDETALYEADGVPARIDAGDHELRASGFAVPGVTVIDDVIVCVRYRTSAPPADDVYRFEASVDGTFTPWSSILDWDRIAPIVGSSGLEYARVLAYPDQPLYREVSTALGPLTPAEIESLAVRVKGEGAGSPDGFRIEWDACWLEVYGIE